MKYLKVWTSFRDLLHTLEYDEIGRLFLMMLEYTETGAEPDEFIGNEAFLFPVAKQMIDLASEKNEKLRQNGLKGGRPKTKQNQTEANETKGNQTKAEKERKGKECNGKEGNESSPFIADVEAREIQNDQNRVLDAAEDAGFKMSNNVRAALTALYADFGLVKVLDGIKSCSEHGAANLAYLRAVLSGKPKQTKPTVTAQDYEQRDYSEVQGGIMDRQSERIRAFMAKKQEVG